MNEMILSKSLNTGLNRPRLGFLGTGWIGRHRMKAILNSGMAEAAAIADASPDMLAEAAKLAPSAKLGATLDDLLALDLDGIVIATPSAQHAEQTVQALCAGTAVFCQKPLGRHRGEVVAALDAAKAADRLLGVDFSYRLTDGIQKIRNILKAGEIGQVFAVDLTFHNAYGPDKPWFYDKVQSGGGCVMDLGVHLVDLALYLLDFPKVERIDSQLLSAGRPLSEVPDGVEDYAVATLVLEGGVTVRLACSWRLQAGQDAVIAAEFYGTSGGASMRNVDGSFYDFVTERFRGTSRELLTGPPEDWGGRAAVAWAERLRRDRRYDPAAEGLLAVTQAIDGIYRGQA